MTGGARHTDREADPAADQQGRHADSPGQIPARGWWSILKRTLAESSRDNVWVVAAGVAFLALLAIFPALTATFSLYGLVADPQHVEEQVAALASVLPAQGREVLVGQLHALASQSGGALGTGLILSLGIALWSASSGVKALMSALNIVYEEAEKRSFLHFTGTALALTLGFILLLIFLIAVVIATPVVLGFLGLAGTADILVRLLRWPLLALALAFALAVLYRYGPSRARARWRWVSWGSAAATLLWIVGSIAFSLYITHFADYNATYGSLGAGIILLLWLYLGAYAVLLGAELDAEMEHQTARDTTSGPERPLGSRNARMADTVAR